MKPFKIKLKDHHADNEQRLAVQLITTEYQIKELEATNLVSNNWIFNDNTFSYNVVEYLELNYFKRTDNKVYTKEDMFEAFKAAIKIPNTEIEIYGIEALFEQYLLKSI